MMQKIIWLASYPKSGNTWLRTFLWALIYEKDPDINEVRLHGMFSGRKSIIQSTDLDSYDLYEEEISLIRQSLYDYLSETTGEDMLFIKIHDAYAKNTGGSPIIPSGSSRAAICIVRNPLDIAASMANHNGTSIDATIKWMNNPLAKSAVYSETNGTVFQLPQLLTDWSSHVSSWTSSSIPFPVLVLRYEDMIRDPEVSFSSVVTFLGIDATPEHISKAIERSRFSNLKKQEDVQGFAEKPSKSKAFFRNGIAGNWINELTPGQIREITNAHGDLMRRYKYL